MASITLDFKNLRQVREVISILDIMTNDPRITENIKEEYKKRMLSIKFEEV